MLGLLSLEQPERSEAGGDTMLAVMQVCLIEKPGNSGDVKSAERLSCRCPENIMPGRGMMPGIYDIKICETETTVRVWGW